MKMRLGVIIPFVTHERVVDLMQMIDRNADLPDVIVLIDNSVSGIAFAIEWPMPVKIVRQVPTPGVNASWEIGAAACGDVDFISFLNDDISITPMFFTRIANAIMNEAPKDLGAICPNTLDRQTFNVAEDFDPDYENVSLVSLVKNKHPEGWAFTIRRDIVSRAMPFPAGMIHFAGDNWLWWITYEDFKMKWYTDKNNLICHEVGASQTKETRAMLDNDHEICSRALLKRFPERHAAGARRKTRQNDKSL